MNSFILFLSLAVKNAFTARIHESDREVFENIYVCCSLLSEGKRFIFLNERKSRGCALGGCANVGKRKSFVRPLFSDPFSKFRIVILKKFLLLALLCLAGWPASFLHPYALVTFTCTRPTDIVKRANRKILLLRHNATSTKIV